MSKPSKQQDLHHILKLYNFDKQQASSFGASLFPGDCTNKDLKLNSSSDGQRSQNANEISIAGFDEAGRGALAGPVVVGCVHFPSFRYYLGSSMLSELSDLDDSKKLSAKRRERLVPLIKNYSVWGIGIASAEEIDTLGIVQAVSKASKRAYLAIGARVELLLCDHGITLAEDNLVIELPNQSKSVSKKPFMRRFHQVPLVHGDGRSLHIAAASVLAKVERDQMMEDLDRDYHGYGFAAHKGYGTAAHLDALRKLGPTSQHRKSFKWSKTSLASLFRA